MISLKETPEPLSEASWKQQPTLAKSDAYETLLREIERYANKETNGRSFLIAGHRGSGKTTMVRWAVHESQRRAMEATSGEKWKLWPMFIPLHGPDLFNAVETDERRQAAAAKGETTSETPTDGDGADQAGSDGKSVEAKNSPVAAVLKVLAKSLHRALMDEMGRQFRRHVEAQAPADGNRKEDWLELAAHLEQELDHAPELATLRNHWRLVGALDSGVLRAGRGEWTKKLPKGQGTRELVAMASAIEAFQLVAGKLTGVDTQTRNSVLEQVSDFGLRPVIKDLLNPLLTVLAGGLLGMGALVQGKDPLVAALLGLGTALGTALTLSITSKNTRKTTRDSNRVFTWDTSVESLDRMLPVLVERMVQAGLAPIFVIDELDKVDKLEKEMEVLIAHLKHFVTERAFFCFLCDRAYFETITAQGRHGQYSRDFTFFSDRLFIHYLPGQLRAHVQRILQIEKAAGAELPATPVPEPTTPSEIVRTIEDRDYDFLCTVLLQGAYSSPIALRRRFLAFTNGDGQCVLEPGEIRNLRGFQRRAFMQFAVEEVLKKSELRERLRQDPQFGRFLLDTLYYPARRWNEASEQLDISRNALQLHLEGRLDSGEGVDRTDKRREKIIGKLISGPSWNLLENALGDLIKILNNPNAFILSFPRAQVEDFNLDILEPYLISAGEPHKKWRWEVDPFGDRVPVPPEPAPPAATEPGISVPMDAGEAAVPPAIGILVPDAPLSVLTLKIPQVKAGLGLGEEKPLFEHFANIAPVPEPRTLGSAVSPSTPPTLPASAPVAAQGPDEEARFQDAKRAANWIEEVCAELEGFGSDIDPGTLAERYRILDLSPPWSSVIPAIGRVAAPGARRDQLKDEIATVLFYESMLRRRGQPLRRALLLAIGISRHQLYGSPGRGMGAGLAAVSRILSLGKLSLETGDKFLEKVVDELWKELSAETRQIFEPALRVALEDLPKWLKPLAEVIERGGDLLWKHAFGGRSIYTTEAYLRWTEAFKGTSFGYQSVFEPKLDDFRLALMGPAPVAFLDDLTLDELWRLADTEAQELKSAIYAFLGVGGKLRPRQKREGEQVLFLAPHGGDFFGWQPSAKHAICPIAGDTGTIDRLVYDMQSYFRPTIVLVHTALPSGIDAVMFGGTPWKLLDDYRRSRIPVFRVTNSNVLEITKGAIPPALTAPSLDQAIELARSVRDAAKEPPPVP